MFVYKNSVKGFKDDVDRNVIKEKILNELLQAFSGRRIGRSEQEAWRNSLGFMERVIRRSGVADDCGILIEYILPATYKRIDFIIAGHDQQNHENFIIVELKQWEAAECTDKDGIVKTFLHGGINETTHPSYQANAYKLFLKDFNETIDAENLGVYSCAYLHNYFEKNPEPLKAPIYQALVDDTPLYLKNDQEKLEQFILQHVGKGNGDDILYKIERGKIKPSKKLIDHVNSMFEGNEVYRLLDEQKVAFELAKNVAVSAKEKSVVLISGGPGTGKSVISVNLLGSLLKEEKNVVFVAPNASFRNVMMAKLAQENSKRRIQHLFKGSSCFVDVSKNIYDAVIVDEAHRLKDGRAYQYHGKNQIRDIINAANVSIFFVDERQMIRPEDIGSINEIKRIAQELGASVFETELSAQFRCAGAEGFINWLDDVLRIRETANFDGWDKDAFDFQIFDDPNKLHEAIKKKNDEGCTARLLAGYAWEWTPAEHGNADGQVCDVEVPEFNFKLPWNSRRVGTTWAIDPSGIDQVGCIHTSQGLEFDYVGVIIGEDLKHDPNTDAFIVDWKSYKDKKGKQGLKDDPEKLSQLVRNIYRVLMTRGMKGCYVFFQNKETEEYFKLRLSGTS